MSVDDDEPQASPCARQAGRLARRAPRSPARAAGQIRGVRPLLRAHRTEVGASAGGHPRRSRCGVHRPLPGVSATSSGTEVSTSSWSSIAVSGCPATTTAGCDLPPEAMTVDQVVDDVAAVLDDAQVDKAVIYGTSYGTYFAAGVGVRHPDRVHAMVLDSPVVVGGRHRRCARHRRVALLWDGNDPETAALAAKVRQLVDGEVMSPAAAQLAAAVYGFAGPAAAGSAARSAAGRAPWLWSGLEQGGTVSVRAQGAVPSRGRPGRPDRLPRTQLWGGARR